VRHNWQNWLLFTPILLGQFGFDFGDIGSFLLGLLSDLLNFLIAVLQFIWQVLVAVANFIFSVLQFVWKFLTTLFSDISKAFKWIWQRIIKEGLTKLLTAFIKVREWLTKIFGPLICYLLAIRCWIDWAFNKFVKPILDAIAHIRMVLKLFRLLGIKWAAKLDAILAKVQADILKAYELIRQNLNQVISWLQLIIDPTFLLRRIPLFGALIRSKEELRNLELQAIVHPISQDEADKMNRNRTWFAPSARADNQALYAQGQLPPDIQAARDQFVAININPGDVSAS
jgi:hypothetical protein